MPKKIRDVSGDDIRRIDRAIDDLKLVRDELRIVGAKRAASYVARAIKSAEGAQRHANGVLSRSHKHIGVGYCKVCHHNGSDCTGTRHV